MSDEQVGHWTERNGETVPPEVGFDECKWFWFEGRASYDDWSKHGDMVVIGKEHVDRVVGLVFLMPMFDMKHPKIDAQGHYVYDHISMIAIPETGGYELNRCEGKWWGPVPMPHFAGDIMLSLALVEDYAEWKAFKDAFETEHKRI